MLIAYIRENRKLAAYKSGEYFKKRSTHSLKPQVLANSSAEWFIAGEGDSGF